MTIINPNSISGITSFTAEADVMNFYRSNGTLGSLQLNGCNFNTTNGISTFNNLNVGGTLTYEDVKNVDSVGIISARTAIHVGAGISAVGIITATSFRGDGSQLTGITGTTINNNANDRIITGSGTANTLEAEATLLWDGTDKLTVYDASSYPTLKFECKTGGGSYEWARFIGGGSGLRIANTNFSANASGDELVLGTTNNSRGITIASGNSSGNSGNIFFADSGSNTAGRISYEQDNDELVFYTGTTERIRITASGVITKYDTRNVSIRTASGSTRGHLQSNGNGIDLQSWVASNGFITFSTNGGSGSANERVRINSAGTVRIKRAVSTSLGNDSIFLALGDTENGSNVNRMIGFGYNSNFGTSVYPASMGYTETDNSGHTKGALTFNTRDSTGATDAPTERLRILASGDVCINRTAPLDSAKLSIQCDATQPAIGVQCNHTNTDTKLISAWNSGAKNIVNITAESDNSPYLKFEILSGNSPVERFRVNHLGNVSIGGGTAPNRLEIIDDPQGFPSDSAQPNASLLIKHGTSGSNRRWVGIGASLTGAWIQSSSPGGSGLAAPLWINKGGGEITLGNEKLRINSNGYVGVKRSTPLANLHTTNNELAVGANPTSAAAPNATYDGLVVDGEAGSFINIRSRGDGNSSYGRLAFSDDTRSRGYIEYRHKDGTGDDWMGFATSGTERMRIKSDGETVINLQAGVAYDTDSLFVNGPSSSGRPTVEFHGNGNNSPQANSCTLHIKQNCTSAPDTAAALKLTHSNPLAGNEGAIMSIYSNINNSTAQRAWNFLTTGRIIHNRPNNDGTLISFRHNNTAEGSISVSGSSVSYNGGVLTRWSQLVGISTNIKSDRPTIYQGTVLSNLDEMCEWAGEDNQQLNKTKVSDTVGDKDVTGVFWGWDDDDDETGYTNDFYIAQTGDFIVRVGASVTVARGDLLESAGDGTAKPQSDDIVRSKTIAKIISTTATDTYADGTKAYPCLLIPS